MLHDLTSGDGYVALKRTAQVRQRDRQTQRKDVKNLLYSGRLLTGACLC